MTSRIIRVHYRNNQRQRGLHWSRQECHKRQKTIKRMIFKGYRSLNAFILVFWSPYWLWLVPFNVRSAEHIQSLPQPWKKSAKTAVYFENHTFGCFWLFLAVFDIPDSFFEVIIVSDWFHKVPWKVSSPEYLKFLTWLWKKRVPTAISFENPLSAVLVPFGHYWCSWRLLWSLHCLRLVP